MKKLPGCRKLGAGVMPAVACAGTDTCVYQTYTQKSGGVIKIAHCAIIFLKNTKPLLWLLPAKKSYQKLLKNYSREKCNMSNAGFYVVCRCVGVGCVCGHSSNRVKPICHKCHANAPALCRYGRERYTQFWGGLCYDGFVKNMHDNNANIIGMV